MTTLPNYGDSLLPMRFEPHRRTLSPKVAEMVDRENQRYVSTVWVIGLVVVAAIGAVTVLSAVGAPSGATNLFTVLGSVVPVLLGLLRIEKQYSQATKDRGELVQKVDDAALKAAAAKEHAEETKAAVTTNMTQVVEAVATEVRQAERDQLISDPTVMRQLAKMVAEELKRS